VYDGQHQGGETVLVVSQFRGDVGDGSTIAAFDAFPKPVSE
jgi:hypothetical protein